MIDASFILFICFMGFTALAFKMGYKKSLTTLDQQITNVAKTVETALISLKQAQEKHTHELQYGTLIDNEIGEIFKRSQHQIEEIQRQAKAELTRLMENKINSSDTRIDRMRMEIMNELNLHITNQVVQTFEALFTTHLSQGMQEKINDHFINELDLLFETESGKNRNTTKSKKAVNRVE